METKLDIKDIFTPFRFNTHNVNLFFNIRDIVEKNMRLDFDVWLPTKNMNLQRPLCWTQDQKQELIISLIKGVYIPKIYVFIDCTEDEKLYQIIDGKQRLYTMISFIKGEFPLVYNGLEYYYDDLSDYLKYLVRSYSPVCEVFYSYNKNEVTDQDKITWFKMINFSGTPQDKEHLNKLNDE